MKRKDALAAVSPLFKDTPCFRHRRGLLGSIGTRRVPATGISISKLWAAARQRGGLPLALPDRKVAILDGDGAVTMNVNGLITVGRVRPKNLIYIVFDNKIYELSGCLPTASAYNLNIANFGRAAGIPSVRESAHSTSSMWP